MVPSRRTLLVLGTLTVLGAALAGVTAAGAQQDGAPAGADPAELLERLGSLEAALPEDAPPVGVTFDPETTWAVLEGDAGGTQAVLATLEADLRRLFVDADDTPGPVAEAVATVARGWLDVWHGARALAVWESHDLAFPLDARDAAGVSTAADQLAGQAEVGLELILQGRQRHLTGYGALRELGEARAEVQALLDTRAREAERFDTDLRPLVLAMLSRPSTSVLVPVERFVTTAPGVEARASSVTLACVDREAFEALGPQPDPEAVLALVDGTRRRADCPSLPAGVEVRPGR